MIKNETAYEDGFIELSPDEFVGRVFQNDPELASRLFGHYRTETPASPTTPQHKTATVVTIDSVLCVDCKAPNALDANRRCIHCRLTPMVRLTSTKQRLQRAVWR